MRFQYASRECRCATDNMKFVENQKLVDSYLETEVGLRRVIGPLEKAGAVPIQIQIWGNPQWPQVRPMATHCGLIPPEGL